MSPAIVRSRPPSPLARVRATTATRDYPRSPSSPGELTAAQALVLDPSRRLDRYLDTTGDGTGTKNAGGVGADFSGGATEFLIAPAAGEVFVLGRMIVTVEDTTGFSAGEYGNLGAALGTGVGVYVRDGSGDVQDLTDGVMITTNAEWGRMCYDVELKTWGAGNEFLVVRWTFTNAAGRPVVLDGDNGEYFCVELADDLTGLVSHYFLVQGYSAA